MYDKRANGFVQRLAKDDAITAPYSPARSACCRAFGMTPWLYKHREELCRTKYFAWTTCLPRAHALVKAALSHGCDTSGHSQLHASLRSSVGFVSVVLVRRLTCEACQAEAAGALAKWAH